MAPPRPGRALNGTGGQSPPCGAARAPSSCAVGAAADAPDAYRAMFFLDQLRWCGNPSDAAKVKALGGKSGEKSVKDFAAMVAAELSAAK